MIPGGFADCVRFRHESNSTAIGTFQGQHCMVDFSPIAGEAVNRSNGFDWREV